ncbi:MAG TPA: L-ribulose-5-phosphate 3-epimerase [Anaerolineales bacterium]|nr:L-ribulose-5-phosphate 3-epimerase [Anaerolineales bacterium]
MSISTSMQLGLYEKALPDDLGWEERLEASARAGYDFIEMSVDESDTRLARLNWPASQRAELRQAIFNTGVPVYSICLSAHRKFPMGSASLELRQTGLDLLCRTFELAADLGARVIQLMGYDVFYEPSGPDTRARFLEGLRQGARWAAAAGVMLAIENIDIEFMNSVEKAMHYVQAINSPWFNFYPDMGNLVSAGYEPISQLRLAEGHMVGIHFKDARPGVVRGVVFGEGQVPFAQVLRYLAASCYAGPMTIELWAHLDPSGDPWGSARAAQQLATRLIRENMAIPASV